MRYSEILVENRDFFIPALAFDAPICVSLLEHCHTGWSGKTRMVWLPGGEKKFDDRFPINGGVECRWGMKKIAIFDQYLGNETKLGHSYGGTPIGTLCDLSNVALTQISRISQLRHQIETQAWNTITHAY